MPPLIPEQQTRETITPRLVAAGGAGQESSEHAAAFEVAVRKYDLSEPDTVQDGHA